MASGLDEINSPDFIEYAKKADLYLEREIFKGTSIKGKELAKAAQIAFVTTGHFIPVEFALAQLQFESMGGTKGRSAKNNPFNVGEFDDGTTLTFNEPQEGLNAYFGLIAQDYLGDHNTLDGLLSDGFINKSGNRYASDPEYEQKIFKQMMFIDRFFQKNTPQKDFGLQQLKR